MKSDAFSLFYDAHKVSIFQIAYSYLRSLEDAEEAVIESFMRLYETKKNFQTEAAQKYYLIRITINVCKDMLKKNKPVLSDDLVIARHDTYDVANIALWDAVSNLNDKYREVIILRYVNDYSYEEIAGALKTNAATIRKRHERAVEELRKILEGGDNENW